MAKPLTQVAIEALQPSKQRREIPDGKVAGLFHIVQPSGSRSWALRYKIDGWSRKFTLGQYPAIDLGEARRLAKQAIGEIAKGGDPAARKRAERVAAKASTAAAAMAVDDLVEKVVDEFVNRYAKKFTRDWKETQRLLQKNVVPMWRGRRLATIQKKDVVRLLDGIVERGAPVGANRVFTQLRKMCSWAIERGIITASPCAGVKPPSPEIERDRVLEPGELALVWRAAAEIGFPFGPVVRLLVLTAQRRAEVAGLRWGELDLDDAIWTLPRERSKNGREHQIPLAPTTVETLSALPRFVGSDFVFSAGKNVPSGYSLAKKRLDREINKLNDGAAIPPWTLHDIRRSVATRLAELKIAPHVVEAILNHKSGEIRGVAAIYNRYSYLTEKRAALEAWARALHPIVRGEAQSNIVVELAAARA
jgi:integrase